MLLDLLLTYPACTSVKRMRLGDVFSMNNVDLLIFQQECSMTYCQFN